MYVRDDNTAVEALRSAGLSEAEIRRLWALRSQYIKYGRDQAPLDPRHLEFARWLVLHGKLTEEIP
jgi:hypothetical protein